MNEKTKSSVGLFLALIAIIVSFTVPEIRGCFGLNTEISEQKKVDQEEEKSRDTIFIESPNIPTELDSQKDDKGNIEKEEKDKPKPLRLVKPNYFNENIQTNIAILTTENNKKISPSLNILLKDFFKSEQLTSTTAFFYSNFLKSSDFIRVLDDDVRIFDELDVLDKVQCICIINQSIDVTQNEHEAEGETLPFTSAKGNYKVKFINLISNEIESFSISRNGAGGDRRLAIEDLEKKFIKEFKKTNINFKLCKN